MFEFQIEEANYWHNASGNFTISLRIDLVQDSKHYAFPQLKQEYIGWFFHWYPPKKLKIGKPRLGESMLTYIVLDTPNLAYINVSVLRTFRGGTSEKKITLYFILFLYLPKDFRLTCNCLIWTAISKLIFVYQFSKSVHLKSEF